MRSRPRFNASSPQRPGISTLRLDLFGRGAQFQNAIPPATEGEKYTYPHWGWDAGATLSYGVRWLGITGTFGHQAIAEDVSAYHLVAAPRVTSPWLVGEKMAVRGFAHALGGLAHTTAVTPSQNSAILRAISALAMTPDGATLVAASLKDILLWSLADRRPTPFATGAVTPDGKVKGAGANALAVTPDGKTLVGTRWDSALYVWNLGDGHQITVTKGHSKRIDVLAVSPDGRVVASGSLDSTARLWSLPDGGPIAVLEGHRGVVGHVLFTPDGTTLITGQVPNWETTGPIRNGRPGMRKIEADAVIALWNVNPPGFRCYLKK